MPDSAVFRTAEAHVLDPPMGLTARLHVEAQRRERTARLERIGRWAMAAILLIATAYLAAQLPKAVEQARLDAAATEASDE